MPKERLTVENPSTQETDRAPNALSYCLEDRLIDTLQMILLLKNFK